MSTARGQYVTLPSRCRRGARATAQQQVSRIEVHLGRVQVQAVFLGARGHGHHLLGDRTVRPGRCCEHLDHAYFGAGQVPFDQTCQLVDGSQCCSCRSAPSGIDVGEQRGQMVVDSGMRLGGGDQQLAGLVDVSASSRGPAQRR
ncbi:hypothetical protein, partial [Rhodococcus sp. BS-15]|uniref:hypothetical protein n=1 Tax=Rhodococcus sp. BS-15 TaxID=1304954 RepID=UPI0035B511B3